MKKEKVIEINVSNKLIYCLLILSILFLGMVTVQAVVGHNADELALSNYYNISQVYTKAEFDNLIAPYIS